MEHEDISYYQGQYKERLLPLLRELRAKEEDSTNSFICVLKKMKEVRLMEKVVEETEEAFTERMEALAEKWRDLHARRAQLKAHVVTSGTTVKENERLRTQALKKAKEEKEENSKKESELLRAREKLEALRKQHQKFSKKLLKYSLFKRYLENVVENSQVSLDMGPMLQFRDIEDIISYYKALLRTRKDLLQSQWWYRQLMEQGKVLQQQIRAKKEAEMLQCKNDLVQLKESLEQAQSDIQQWVRSSGRAGELPKAWCSQERPLAPPAAAARGTAQQQSCCWEDMPEPTRAHGAAGGAGRARWEQVCHEEELEAGQGWAVAMLLLSLRPALGKAAFCPAPMRVEPGVSELKQLCWDVSCAPQEDHWAEVQERAAGKATELKSLTMAIHSLFQAASARLQPKGRVAAGDSHRQLDMVKPEQSLLPAQEKQQEWLSQGEGEPPGPTQPPFLPGVLGQWWNTRETWPFPAAGAGSGSQIQQFIYDLQDFTEDMKERSRPL
ncbi:coiled-coil domain-containing protein 42 [Parus major]|uniref:coiled-coil domain-containing protein 42 n=1 Tax=Parus major TaxID=9157 RepID=UPI001443CEC0|nr:coiled-coil domain-containing protein 42 [Parus major]